MTFRRGSLAGLLMLVGAACAFGQAPADDERFLKERGVQTDAASLLSFLRRQASVCEPVPADFEQLVAALGDRSFAQRETATRRLIDAGPPALERLRAVTTRDAEIRRRLDQCIGTILAPPDPEAGACAVPLLLRLNPPGLAAALIAYVPFADAQTVETIWYALDARAHDGKLDPALRAALTDQEPRRRALAAYLLARYRTDLDRLWVRLGDREPEVRLRAAQGLLGACDRSAVPALVDLLDDTPVEIAWQAEELLRWVAREQAPTPTLESGTAAKRIECQVAWRRWCREWGKRFDWVDLANAPRRPGLVLAGGEKGLSLCGSDGAARWRSSEVTGDRDALLLPGPRLLALGAKSVSEQKLDGGRVWSGAYWDYGDCTDCQRLANGNTIVATGAGLLELGPTGEPLGLPVHVHVKPVEPEPPPPVVFRRGRMVPPQPVAPRPKANEIAILRAVRLRSGHTLAVSLEELIEIDESGMVVRQTPLPGTVVRPRSQFVVFAVGGYCFADGDGRLLAVDAAGKVAWQRPQPSTAIAALRNGNLLAAAPQDNRLLELDATGRLVGETYLDESPTVVRDAFPLLRLGFERPKGDDLDAAESRIAGLRHRDVRVRRTAALTLRAGEPRAARALVAALDDPDTAVRDFAIYALSQAVPATLSDLLAALDHPSPRRRAAAWDALIKAGPAAAAAVPAVVKRFNDPQTDQDSRRGAVDLLGAIGPDAVAALPALLTFYEHDAVLRDRVYATLLKIDGGADLVPLLAARSADNRLAAEARLEAGQHLRQIVSAIPELTDTLSAKNTSGEARRAAGQRLWELKRAATRAAEPLAKLLRDRNQPDGLRLVAAQTLQAAGDAAHPVLPVCGDVLSDPELPPKLRDASLRLLFQWGPGAVEVLTELLLVGPPAVREWSAERLGVLGDDPAAATAVESALPILRLAATDDEDGKVRIAARAAAQHLDGLPPRK